ncbi:MAG TPA: tetratricopeptide repeat protein [Edaphobacter sp.]|jgi:tetratricopeptide (TPR) repeat protein|nr:tetratricopeptide repeat protein [Edaphobacter sp.]
MSTRYRSSLLLVFFLLLIAVARVRAQKDDLSPEALRQIEHADPQWAIIQPHLPDPLTATAEKLEMAGDVLRARRFPNEALDYYSYAVRRGGKEVQLLNKMGITELELRHNRRARAYFQRVVQLKKKSAEGWNNLGAVEYLERRFGNAISDYNRAIKLNKKGASYHSNLATAYFEQKDYESARKEYDIALKLDPDMFERTGSGGGVTAHMLSPVDHARYCFEMARLFAQRGDEDSMMRFLTKASEGGFNILEAMGPDSVLNRYRKDPRVLLVARNADAMRNNRFNIASVPGGAPQLPPPLHE